MTKERYMALADLQSLWSDQIKPSLPTKDNVTAKADKVSGSGLNGHIAALNSNGNLKDSGLTGVASVATCESIIDELT